jgi:hypothetical protein
MARKRDDFSSDMAPVERPSEPARSRFAAKKPLANPGPRERLCRRLELNDPSDAQLFGDAAARITALENELAKAQK